MRRCDGGLPGRDGGGRRLIASRPSNAVTPSRRGGMEVWQSGMSATLTEQRRRRALVGLVEQGSYNHCHREWFLYR